MTTRARRLQSEIAHLEARYDDHFPPCIYKVLQKLRAELVEASLPCHGARYERPVQSKHA